MNSGEEHLWKDLDACDPADVCRRALCKWVKTEQCYRITVMLREYLVCPGKKELFFADTNEKAKTEVRVFILSYLVNAKDAPPSGELVSPMTLKSGPTFFRGPHIIWVQPIIDKFGSNPEAFARRAKELGAEPYPFGDAGMQFFLFPRIPAAYILHRADDEFPAEVTVLFDRSIEAHLPLDMIWGAIFFMTKIIAG